MARSAVMVSPRRRPSNSSPAGVSSAEACVGAITRMSCYREQPAPYRRSPAPPHRKPGLTCAGLGPTQQAPIGINSTRSASCRRPPRRPGEPDPAPDESNHQASARRHAARVPTSRQPLGKNLATAFHSPQPDNDLGRPLRARRKLGRPTIRNMSLDFPAFALSEEHDALRASVRALAEEKIAPHAAKVDEAAEFPQDAHDALVKADLHAVHIPEQYGGAGADAIATVIVIEEVARACASSSLIPAVNKLGTVPLLLSASEELKQQFLPPVARGAAMFSYALSEPEAGSDAAAMRTRAVRDGDSYVLNGTKRWITNAGVSQYYTVMAVTDPAAGANGISAFVLRADDPGFSVGAPEHKLGIKGSPTCELYFDDCAIPASRLIGTEGEGFKIALRTLDHTRITIAAQALGIAQGALDYATNYVKERHQFGHPIADFQGVQFMLA